MSWSSPKLQKVISWRKNYSQPILPFPLKSRTFAAIREREKMRVKRSRDLKYFFYKNNAENNWTFHMQMMLKGGNKHARMNCDTCDKYPYGRKRSVVCFQFEQLSIIPVVSFLLTFNKYTVFSFSMHHFYVSKYN